MTVENITNVHFKAYNFFNSFVNVIIIDLNLLVNFKKKKFLN